MLIGYADRLSAQCTNQVTNVSGTVTIGCTNVTVTSAGTVDVLTTYCASTTPFFIGYNYGTGSGTGSYTFTFSPPVSSLTLNVSGISEDPTNAEEIRLYVNGVHYAIPAAGTPNGCDPMAVLTGSGDIDACANCSVSGWNGTTIAGPISSLVVLDTLLRGAAAGSLFSLFICNGGGGGSVNLGKDTTICQGNTLTLDATTAGATYTWSTGATSPTIVVDTTGTYFVAVHNGGCSANDTIHVTVLPRTSNLSIPVCSSSYTYNGHVHAAPGTYFDTLVNGAGCDSIVHLILISQAVLTTSLSQSICNSSSIVFGGHTISTAGTYRDTLTGIDGCDSIVVLTLSVIPVSTHPISQSICTGSSIVFNGQTISTAGIYRDTLTNVAGCDSIVMLTLAVQSILTTSLSQSICAGSRTVFGGQTISTAGTYMDTLTSASGCDSIITLTLSVTPIATTSISQTICGGSSIVFNGQAISTAGTYRDTLTNVAGCDSIVMLTLAVQSILTTSLSQSICAGTSTVFGGQTISTAGTYMDTLTSASGCDSIITLTLSVTPIATTSISQTICGGSSIVFNGQTISTAGVYRDTLTNAAGCDSIVTLTLSLTPVSTTSISQSICIGSSVVFNGQTISTAGTYLDTLTGAAGCDSIVTLTLSVIPSSTTFINRSICSGSIIAFGSQALSATGIYSDTLTGVSGCDSIVVLNLTVQSTHTTILNQAICAGTSIVFAGQTIFTAGTYLDTLTSAAGCDSIINNTVSVIPVPSTSISQFICSGSSFVFNGQSISTAGIYPDTLISASGCDSIVTLSLTVLPRPMAAFVILPSGASIPLGDIAVSDASQQADALSWQLNNNLITLLTGGKLPITEAGNYCVRLIASSTAGCADTSEICIDVYGPDHNNSFYMPNAFTPNGDGINDAIKLYGDKGNIKFVSISVFNRWGERVFVSNDLDFAWDGHYKGQMQEPGLYVYTLDVVFSDDHSVNKTGSISLIK
jgi:gliding motility-associated-like protein